MTGGPSLSPHAHPPARPPTTAPGPHWRERLQQRARLWVQRRAAAPQPRVSVERARLYILPTRFGLAFAALCVLMLVTATHYGNSLMFLLCFLLTSLGLVCMHQTHAMLAGVDAGPATVEPVFAGDAATLRLCLHNAAALPRLGLVLGVAAEPGGSETVFDLPAQDSLVVELPLTTTRRGVQALPLLRLHSSAPLGLFRAWTYLSLDARLLVYPRPAARGQPPPPAGRSGRQLPGGTDEPEFDGFRAYQSGDPPSRIHWKSLARHGQALVPRFDGRAGDECWLDWQDLPGLDVEPRLSQLTRWVIDADAAAQRYGLVLPGLRIELAQGAAQRQRCLQALACHDGGDRRPRRGSGRADAHA